MITQCMLLFQVLELKKTATQSEIRSRYRELSKKWHPDKYQSEEDKEEANTRYLIYVIFLKYLLRVFG